MAHPMHHSVAEHGGIPLGVAQPASNLGSTTEADVDVGVFGSGFFGVRSPVQGVMSVVGVPVLAGLGREEAP